MDTHPQENLLLLDQLKLSKALDPLPAESLKELERITRLTGLASFTEADVREEIISPILRLLGYDKGDKFSVARERRIDVQTQRLFIDYSMSLFEADFWLIEAKRPNLNAARFARADLWQALKYAIHPEINAALVVLCDGQKFEVYDREANLDEPILRLQRENLARDFDQLRTLLSPWQAYFFQKRRVIRLIDKVFDREYNHQRMIEFRELVDRQLRGKRSRIWENTRTISRTIPGYDTPHENIQNASTEEIIDGHLFRRLTAGELHTAVETLIARCDRRAFDVLYRMFPDEPRDVNDWYYIGALRFLIRLAEVRDDAGWLPDWLCERPGSAATDGAVRKLIGLGLTTFEADPARKAVLLFSAAARRVLKILCVTSRDIRKVAEARHAAERHFGDEMTFRQMIASPNGQLLGMLEVAQMTATESFVRRHIDDRDRFLTASARLDLAQTWAVERSLLKANPNYWTLLEEANLGEAGAVTEHSAVTYDQSGHGVLVALDMSPKWRDYTLSVHRGEVEQLAAMGSWQARDWLGLSNDAKPAGLPDEVLAERFFFGDLDTLHVLRDAYRP